MFDLVFLGTSASTPSAHRGLSAHMIMHRQYRFLLDCGEGTQRQILRSGLGFKRLDKVLLTHSHLDHIMGLGGLVSTLARWDVMEKFDIYGGRATLSRVSDLVFRVALRGNRTPTDVNLVELKPYDVILEDSKFKLSAFPVEHRGPDCLGYLFEEKSRRPFLEDKAAELDIPAGPERGHLVRGETVTLPDGRIIEPDQVLGEEIPGTKYVHIGDVGRTDTLIDICRDADALVVESTYTKEETEMAADYGHLTATQAAELAIAANVHTLILTHISRRHTEREIKREARAIFPNTFVARDFDHYQISRRNVVRLKQD